MFYQRNLASLAPSSKLAAPHRQSVFWPGLIFLVLLDSFGCGAGDQKPVDGGALGDVPLYRDGSVGGDGRMDVVGLQDSRGADASCPPVVAPGTCEAVAGGTCYYVDPVAGDDSFPGTYGEPWRTFVNINKSIYAQYRPAGWVELQPGDVLYLMGGVHDAIYHPGDDSGPQGGGNYVVYMRQLHGEQGAPITIKGYPGMHPVLDPGGQGIGVFVSQSENVLLEGLEIRNAYSRGVRLSETAGIVARRLLVWGTDGPHDDNVSGLEVLGCQQVEIEHSVFHDNFDRSPDLEGTQVENGCNIHLFSASDVVIHHSIFYQSGDPSSPYSGCGVKFKHASRDLDASFEVYACYFENHRGYALGTGTAHSSIHHNIFVGGPVALRSRDFGGRTHQWDQQFFFNTIYGAGGFYMTPTLNWVDDEGGAWPDVTDIAFYGNIVVDNAESYDGERRTVLLDAYMSDELYLQLRPNISFASNCYYNPNLAVSFGFAEAGNYGELGGVYSLQEWQAEYGYDMDSVEEDPGLEDPQHMNFHPAADGPCSDMGALTDGLEPPLDKNFVFACEDAS